MKKRILMLCLALVLVISSTSTVYGFKNLNSKAAPTPLSIIIPGEPDINAENDRVFAELEKRTNTKLTIVNVPWDKYGDKLNIMAVSGELPDIVVCADPGNKTVLNNWIDQGIIVPFNNDMLKAAPDIKKEYDSTSYYKEIMVNGKIYFQPIYWNTNVSPNTPLHVRKDMLDKLGLATPKTLDELYTAMKMMKDKLNVYFGLAAKDGNPMNAMNFVFGSYGLCLDGWTKDSTGNYKYANIQPGALSALKWAKKLYTNKILDPAVFTLDGTAEGQAEQNYFTGKYGFFGGGGGGHIARFQERLSKNNPKAQEWVIPAVAGPQGKRGYGVMGSFWGYTLISGNAKDPVAAAKFLNYLVSPEGQMLTQFGIEGIHYTYKGEKKLANIQLNAVERAKEGKDHWDADRYHQLAAPYVSWVPQPVQDFFAMNGKSQATKAWYAAMWKNQGQYMMKNDILLNTTPKWVAFQKTSKDLTDEYYNKIILSSKNDADALFKEYVSKWNKAGGAAASIEMSNAAKKLYAK